MVETTEAALVRERALARISPRHTKRFERHLPATGTFPVVLDEPVEVFSEIGGWHFVPDMVPDTPREKNISAEVKEKVSLQSLKEKIQS